MVFIGLLFKGIILSSAMGSFLVIIILLIKKLFKSKLSASWHYYIWLLLILRLAIPYSYQSPISIFNIFTNTLSNIQVPLSVPIIKNSEVKQNNVSNNKTTVTNNPIIASETNIKDIRTGDFDLFNIASIIWFVVMISTLLFIFVFNMIFNKRLRNQEICKDKENLDILKSCQDMTAIKGNIPITYSGNISGVSLHGVFKPKILISSAVIHNFTVEQKNHIFLHELIHLKYKDILINSIMLILVAFNWFNPIIWYSFYKMQQDCELACDEKVLHYLQPNCYNNYGITIINMAALFSKSHNLFNSTALASSKSNLKRRISMINSYKAKSFKWSLLGLSLITLIAIVCLVNPKSQSNSNTIPVLAAINLKQGIGTTPSTVYLVAKDDGQLTQKDIKQHPEVLVVNSFQDLTKVINQNKNIAIWIDKNATNLIENGWLLKEPQKNNLLVLIGYDNSLYSFREQLNLGIHGPKVDWNTTKVGNGFSVWYLTKTTSNSINATTKGYSDKVTIDNIFKVTDEIIEQTIQEKLDNITHPKDIKIKLSSNPYDSIRSGDGNTDYKYIVSLGKKSLNYMLNKFANNDSNSFEEYIMAIACSEILKENTETKNWSTGRGWYNNYIKENK